MFTGRGRAPCHGQLPFCLLFSCHCFSPRTGEPYGTFCNLQYAAGQVKVFSRNCEERTASFPDVADAMRAAAEGAPLFVCTSGWKFHPSWHRSAFCTSTTLREDYTSGGRTDPCLSMKRIAKHVGAYHSCRARTLNVLVCWSTFRDAAKVGTLQAGARRSCWTRSWWRWTAPTATS